MSGQPIQPVSAILGPDVLAGGQAVTTSTQSASHTFASWLMNKVDKANHDLIQADGMAKAFALDDSIPVHQVTYAMEQAKISLEIMLQVRTHLVDAYQELTRMQL